MNSFYKDEIPDVINKDLVCAACENDKINTQINNILHIKLENKSLIRIDNLSVLRNLVSISLSNNKIEKIENLQQLVSLKKLDLSFNFIRKLENLDTLTKLEILLLNSNKISKIENLNKLSVLKIFNLANNILSDFDSDIMALKELDTLKCLNLKGNSYKIEVKKSEIRLILPQIDYFNNQLVNTSYFNDYESFASLESLLEKYPFETQNDHVKIFERIKTKALGWLTQSSFFKSLFEMDEFGFALNLAKMNSKYFDDFHRFFNLELNNLYDLIKHHSFDYADKIENYLYNYNLSVSKNEQFQQTEISEINSYVKDSIFSYTKNETDFDADKIDLIEYNKGIQTIQDKFNTRCHDSWKNLMKFEFRTHENIEQLNKQFIRQSEDSLRLLIENAKELFTNLRNHVLSYKEDLSNSWSEISSNAVPADDTQHCAHVLENEDSFKNATSLLSEYHMKILDQNEDCLLNMTKDVFGQVLDNIERKENTRHRTLVFSILETLEHEKRMFFEVVFESTQSEFD